jgi:hypothetical protein
MPDIHCTIRKSDWLADWYVIERKEHGGREWLERIGPGALAFCRSARLGNADIEGTGEEMRAIASAIIAGEAAGFTRCAVSPRPDGFALWSPRNSIGKTVISKDCALELAEETLKTVPTEEPR